MTKKKNIIAIVQARMDSTRFPGKVMKFINGVPLIELLLYRLNMSKEIDSIVVATSKDQSNDILAKHVKKIGYEVFRGSENNVLDRFCKAALKYNADVVVRITGDCPLIDPKVVDTVINKYLSNDVDYVCNTNPPTYPDGLDVEVFSVSALKVTNKQAKTQHEREHVTPYMQKHGNFKITNVANNKNYSNERWTVDEVEDYMVVKSIFEYFSPRVDFNWTEVLQLNKENPELFYTNKNLIRNEGAIMNSGQKLWKRAKKIIPGGNMLLSKRPEMFLPENWPSYFSRSKGCMVWDLDGKKYIDMSIMGVGTNILGYGHPEVDESVIKAVKDGNMSTFNCPEEVFLAEKLIDIHPWADMVRFSRSGGEINSIAVRIARTHTKKDKIAICGYHGWHDWYLSTNLNNNKNLDGHLLPGLQPNGVPRGLLGTTLPFDYNNIAQLEQIIKDNHGEIAAIKMEVSRNEGPNPGYLEKVRDLATENNIILIFDECTSGFRETFGGLHKKYKVEPDIAIFAKALGNGYAISACIGREDVMQSAQKTFISSTFWTERVGPTAALKTLEVMEREKSWNKISQIGSNISSQWKILADKYNLDISTWGLPALSGYTFNYNDSLKYKTFITQEMLKKGYLANNSVYVCTEHSKEVVLGYFSELDPLFAMVKSCEDNNKNIDNLLDGPVCHSSFSRLN